MKSPKCEFITRELIDGVCCEARLSSRLRKNYNLHRDESEPVNRLLNAMHRGSYIPVHRHLNPSLSESCVVLRGRVGVVVYDQEGVVTHSQMVGDGCEAYGFDIEAGLWHGLVVLEDDTVLYEVKQGPYTPISTENIAPWTPAVDDKEAVAEFVKALEKSFE